MFAKFVSFGVRDTRKNVIVMNVMMIISWLLKIDGLARFAEDNEKGLSEDVSTIIYDSRNFLHYSFNITDGSREI